MPNDEQEITDFSFVLSAFAQFKAAADVLRSNLKQFHAARGIEEPNLDSISLSDLAKLVNRYYDIRK